MEMKSYIISFDVVYVFSDEEIEEIDVCILVFIIIRLCILRFYMVWCYFGLQEEVDVYLEIYGEVFEIDDEDWDLDELEIRFGDDFVLYVEDF